MINRRTLLIGLPLGTLIASPSVQAQQKSKVIGVLSAHNSREDEPAHIAFVRAMLDLGYVEDRQFRLATRFADGRSDRLPSLAAELAGLNVDVILASGTPAAIAVSKATATIPIVFDSVSDPVQSGLADSLGHPGHNSTGLSNFSGDLAGKRLQLLSQMVPNVTRVGLLLNPANQNLSRGKPSLLAAAVQLGLTTFEYSASTPEEVEPAFKAMAQQHVQAVYVQADVFLWDQRQRIADLALKNKLPSMCPFAVFAEVGGLMSYGVDVYGAVPQLATYVDKIFRGAKPSELPIQQPTRIDLVINHKTADALQLGIPRSLLVQATKVIE